MKLIYVPIEVKSREFIPKLFFVSRALKKNYACFVGDKIAVNRSIRLFKGGVYFHKSLNKNDKDYIIDIQSKVDGYISLDEEAGSSFKNEKELDNLLDYRSSEINVRNVNRIYNWGDFDNKVWKKKYPKFKYKFKKTGLPRTDIWKKKVSQMIFDKEINYLKKKYGDFIFIPSTFISSKKKLDQLIKNEKKRILNTHYLKKRIESRKFEYQLFLEFKKLISKLSKDTNSLNIVVKPHPSELIQDWEIFTKKFNNVFVDNKFEITPYIQASKLVIFNSSTAGIQSMLMKKKTICFKPVSDEKSLRNFPNKFGVQCRSYNYLKKIILKKEEKKKDQQLKLLKQRLHLSNEFASDIIINDINIKFKKLKNFRYNKFLFILLSKIYWIKSLLKIDKLFILFSKKKDKNLPTRSMDKKLGSGIVKNEIDLIFKKLKFRKYNLKNLGKNGYLIYR